ncbi:MAG TPA: cysteine desulfurase [Candidatus Choladousia intestinipullorum]|nr:cysteine desulfurase [Candidatus Choladousia intestinipullorum]
MEAYLDNSATTRCTQRVRDAVVQVMMEDYGNPSSKHMKGVEAERYLKDARETVARTLKVNEKEIYFTSGATESNNWALIGAARANRRAGMHLITTAVEHPAVLMPMQYLEEQGFRVTYLPVDSKGHISLQDLEQALCEDTILVSMMYVNNEVGTVEPIEEAARIVKKYNPDILFHTDAVQAYGKMRIYPKRAGIDMLSVSAHKIHGPKGIGFLYVNEKVKIHPLILGGGQQKGMRSGTDNVPGAAGLAQAAREAYERLEESREHLLDLKKRMTDGLEQMDSVAVLSEKGDSSAPHIVSASFPGVRSEVLLHALEDRGIYVSAGSACSSNKKLPVSAVLKELHLSPELLDSTLRFSFSRYTTAEEIDYCLQALRELLPVLRRYARH